MYYLLLIYAFVHLQILQEQYLLIIVSQHAYKMSSTLSSTNSSSSSTTVSLGADNTTTKTQGVGASKTKANKKNLKKKQAARKVGPDGKPSRIKRRDYTKFNTAIYNVLQQVSPGMGISKKSMLILNSFAYDVLDRVGGEGIRVTRQMAGHGKAPKTLDARAIQTGTKLVLTGDLAKHAVAEGTKAVYNYANS